MHVGCPHAAIKLRMSPSPRIYNVSKCSAVAPVGWGEGVMGTAGIA